MGSYLEEFLTHIQTIPSEIKRNFQLMRNLDVMSQTVNGDLNKLRSQYLEKLKVAVATGELKKRMEEEEMKTLMEQITEKHKLAIQKADEKVAIASQSFDIVEKCIKHLGNRLKRFENEMKFTLNVQEVTTLRSEFLREETIVNKKKRPRTFVPETDSFGHKKLASKNVAQKRNAKELRNSKNIAHKHATKALKTGETLNEASTVCTPAADGTALAHNPIEEMYCICGRTSYNPDEVMVGCDGGDDCPGRNWFHLKCVGLQAIPDGDWLCSFCAEKKKGTKKRRKGGK